MTKKGKYYFELDNINIENVHRQYGIPHVNFLDTPDPEPDDTTKLTELNTNKGNPSVISFLDENKRHRNCHVSMIDFDSKKEVTLLRYHCFWDRHPFNTQPIGCPIKYVPDHAIKKYYSYISKDTYTIKQDVSKERCKTLDENIKVRKGGYYETDGVFCSFNCCQAYINANKHDRRYDHSSVLLLKMYTEMTNTEKNVSISPASHWRTLSCYGGHQNIVRFRENFNKIDYVYHGTSSLLPKFISTALLYEEKIKF